jgi:hypothetical protein
MQSALLLPVTYFMFTFTLPDTLNVLARSNQAFIYSLFFQTAARALQKLARDPKFVGGQLGFFGVLQTWARDLAYHPHLHFIVAGGGLSKDGMQWLTARQDFLVPVKALSKIFRAKFRDALKKKPELFAQVPPETWQKPWVVHGEPVGSGDGPSVLHHTSSVWPSATGVAEAGTGTSRFNIARVTLNNSRPGRTAQESSSLATRFALPLHQGALLWLVVSPTSKAFGESQRTVERYAGRDRNHRYHRRGSIRRTRNSLMRCPHVAASWTSVKSRPNKHDRRDHSTR